MVRRGIHPDLLTDQTSAHDPVNGYLPEGWTLDEWFAKHERDPAAVAKAAKASMAVHVRAPLDLQAAGVRDTTYGHTTRQIERHEGHETALVFPDSSPAYDRPRTVPRLA